jgi:hypothetical protein
MKSSILIIDFSEVGLSLRFYEQLPLSNQFKNSLRQFLSDEIPPEVGRITSDFLK